MTQHTTPPGTLPAKPKIYILDAFHEAGIALARQHADGVMLRMTPVTAEHCVN
jgi:alkanesulfonate monooxygenase SsuD/methylene tetrahydromethanopterin reductase-like flavin-dependent oxidoreductase (luciferase family)